MTSKPKIHSYAPVKRQCSIDDVDSTEKNKIKKLFMNKNIPIIQIQKVLCYKLWKKYIISKDKLKTKIRKKPKEYIMYHITKNKYAKSIAKNGLDISRSKYRAFGKGVNLSNDITHLKRYKDILGNPKDATIIVCQVYIGESHANYSDGGKDKEYHKKYGHSKPKYMSPKKGYDSMYAANKTIWIIPSSARVYPLFLIKIKL